MSASATRAASPPARRPARSARRTAVVVLAAGKGKRLKSSLPKVLHEVCGKPSLWHVLRAGLAVRPDRVVIVVGKEREQVEAAVGGWSLRGDLRFADQGEPLGTGHATLAAEDAVAGFDEVVVLAGADPLVTGDQVRSLLRVHRRSRAAATILTTRVSDPTGYGRIVRDGDTLVEIAEEADASPEVRAIDEVAALAYAFRRDDLYGALPLVGRENRQHEYYLHSVFPILQDKGQHVRVVRVDMGGALGFDTRAGLARVAGIMRERIVAAHMANGVTFVDPSSAYVDAGVRIGQDTVVQPMTFLQGDTRVGANCRLGPSTRLVDTVVADGAEVTFAVVRQSRIGRGATVGPYASLRPGTVLDERAKAGTFVEMKKTRVGRGSKVPHLSYVGDATIGRSVNVGAGTITCNYDGYEKHPTVIGDEAFIGSDTMLVAPVKVGRRAWTGAGSAVVADVPAGSLVVERSERRTIAGYDERKRRTHGGRPPGGSGTTAEAGGRRAGEKSREGS